MKIKYEKYTIEPENNQFNLYKSVKSIKKDTGLEYEREENMGWGMRYETCIERIIKDKLAERDEIISLRKYIDEYKLLKTNLLDAL